MTRHLRFCLLAGLTILLVACSIDREFRPGPEHVVLQSGAECPGACPDSLLVVSYNIQFAEHVDQAIIDLREAGLDRPDILLLQEMTPEGVEAIAETLGLNHIYHAAAVHPHHGEFFGNAVLSPWPIVGDQLLVLPHPHPWSGQDRIAVAGDLDIGGRRVRAISLHLATAVVAARQRFEQATTVVDSLLIDCDGAVVVGGDFNTSAPNDIINIRKYYRRAARLLPAHLPADCTVEWHMWRILGVGCKLDHLFLRGLDDGTTGVATGATASDHFPVWARVGWPTR